MAELSYLASRAASRRPVQSKALNARYLMLFLQGVR